MTTAKNIRVSDMLRVLSTFEISDFINLHIIIGVGDNPDKVKISLSPVKKEVLSSQFKFSFKDINNYI